MKMSVQKMSLFCYDVLVFGSRQQIFCTTCLHNARLSIAPRRSSENHRFGNISGAWPASSEVFAILAQRPPTRQTWNHWKFWHLDADWQCILYRRHVTYIYIHG